MAVTKKKAPEELKKAGRPTDYDEQVHIALIDLASKDKKNACTNPELADFLEISLTSLDRWSNQHPLFRAAIARAKDVANNRVRSSMYLRAIGTTTTETKLAMFQGQFTDEKKITVEHAPDINAAARFLMLRDPEARRAWNSQQVEMSGPGGGPIKTLTGQLTPQQAAELYKQKILDGDDENQ